MSDQLYAVLAISIICISVLTALLLINAAEYKKMTVTLLDRHIEKERGWNDERQQLLDRIQAPSFSEMKHAEVKVIKAQQGIKDPAPLEIL